MYTFKILLVLTVLVFGYITLSSGLSCWTCQNKAECVKPTRQVCSPYLADHTKLYLNTYHSGVNLNATSPYYDCFRESMKIDKKDIEYKGCSYTNVRGCTLPLRYDIYQSSKVYCQQCNHTDYCNPATRANMNLLTVGVVMVTTLVAGRYLTAA